jgi:predicted alpha/beta superfamily hydrolase
MRPFSQITQAMPHYPIIELIDRDFKIPQMDKKRRIWALLPHDYYDTDKQYPVLYLQDAQNLFDNDAPFGSWSIDRHLMELSAAGDGDLIVIGIDHGGRERIQEYSPYFHRKFGEGQGKNYANFIIDTLKPHVDSHYRTKPHRMHTGIGGSSMGGLISAYIGIVHPKHFSKLMIFSPSFWYSDEIYFDAFKYKYTLPMRMFIYAGEKETRFMSQHINQFKEAVAHNIFSSNLTTFNIVIDPNGQHQEKYWGDIFPAAVKWLFFSNQDE